MGKESITVLLIEDNAGDARLVRETLEEETRIRVNLLHATNLQTGLERLAEGDVDVALLDLTLPDSQGIETFNQVLAHSPHLPIVVLTGVKDEISEKWIFNAGGQDFLNKGFLNLTVVHQTIRHAIMRKQAAIPDRSKDAIAAAKRAHDQFLSLLGDELRVPLNLALANVRAVTDERVTNTERSSKLASCRRYLEQQARLVDDLVTFAQVGTQCAEFRPTASEAALKWAVSDLKSSIDEAGAVVTHDPLPSLWADESQIRQLFRNLIAHAIKYRGEAPPRIHVAAERKGEEWVFSIVNNGIGFDQENSERLFTICRRLRANDKYGGTGFDLAIGKKIVERHAGHIWAKSAPGQGSRFFFTIPTRADGEE